MLLARHVTAGALRRFLKETRAFSLKILPSGPRVTAWRGVFGQNRPKSLPWRVSKALAVEQVQLALIPDEAGTGEILTYEFRALRGDDTFLIYVNVATGEEERILQVIQTENGTFAL